MTYFIHLNGSGPTPQSGYSRVSRYRNPGNGDIWVLWATELSQADVRASISGTLFMIGDDPDTDILAVYPDMIAQKRARIRAIGSIKLANVAGEYCAEERETWPQQQAEAEAYQATGDSGQCPLLSQFASARGISIDLLAAGILENVASFKESGGQVMGQMYALLDQVNAAKNLATAMDVEWS